MSKISIIAELVVKPEYIAAYHEHIKAHAARSLREDRGCRQFDVMVPTDRPDAVFLYEIYDDEACFKEHAESLRMAEYREATRDMLLERRVTQSRVIGP